MSARSSAWIAFPKIYLNDKEVAKAAKDEFGYNNTECAEYKDSSEFSEYEDSVAFFYAEETKYGMFELIEPILQKKRMAYDRKTYSDGWEIVSHTVYFRPEMDERIVLTTQQEDEPFVTVSEIREALKEGGAEAVTKLCDELEGKDIKPLESYT